MLRALTDYQTDNCQLVKTVSQLQQAPPSRTKQKLNNPLCPQQLKNMHKHQKIKIVSKTSTTALVASHAGPQLQCTVGPLTKGIPLQGPKLAD